MTVQSAPWPKQGPASYFPSIEKKYGRSIGAWQQIIANSGLEQHMAVVDTSSRNMEWGMGTPTRWLDGRGRKQGRSLIERVQLSGAKCLPPFAETGVSPAVKRIGNIASRCEMRDRARAAGSITC